MSDSKQPLAEVFGHHISDLSAKATRYRTKRLCPFNNKVPNCTKDKANNPLGVCSVFDAHSRPVITCPVRFRENWMIADDAADFFFGPDVCWTSLTEVKLADKYGKSAGNIDVVLVAYDEQGKVFDFGSLEIQAVYISGNVRMPFEKFMKEPESFSDMDWSRQANYPRPDFLSSSRKRLAPQLMFKGGILNTWGKKMAVALDARFFETLPSLREVDPENADMLWLIYDLIQAESSYQMTKIRTVYTTFAHALKMITKPKVGDVNDFMALLQTKVDEKLDHPPVNRTIESPLDS